MAKFQSPLHHSLMKTGSSREKTLIRELSHEQVSARVPCRIGNLFAFSERFLKDQVIGSNGCFLGSVGSFYRS